MRDTLTFFGRLGGAALFLLFGVANVLGEDKKAVPAAGQLQFEAYLVWGTTNSVSPNDKHKPVSAEIEKKLHDLPLKWSNYFLCKEVPIELSKSGEKLIKMSDKLSIRVKDLNGRKMEVVAIDKKGDEILKRTQPLPVGEYFVLAGAAPGANAWFVILKRIK